MAWDIQKLALIVAARIIDLIVSYCYGQNYLELYCTVLE